MSKPSQEQSTYDWNILVTSKDVPKVGIDVLKANSCNVNDIDAFDINKETRKAVLEKLAGEVKYDAIFLASHHEVDKEFLDAAGERLKVIATMSSGYDHLNIKEIRERGILIGHTPDVLSAAVAEIAVMLMLSAARRAYEGRMILQIKGIEKRGPQWLLGQDLRGSTVGIFGLGKIGQAIVRRLSAFEIGSFIYTTRTNKNAVIEAEFGAKRVEPDELLKQSDFLVVAAPLTDETTGFFNDAAFDKMKNTAVFVNVSRGKIVNTLSLLKALRSKKIFAAGLDVTDPEPLPRDHELLRQPNLEIVPHLGSATIRTRNDMARITAENILNGLRGNRMQYRVE